MPATTTIGFSHSAKTETFIRVKDRDVQRKITTKDWPAWKKKNSCAEKHGSGVLFVVDRMRKLLRKLGSIEKYGEDVASYEEGLGLTVEALTLFLEEMEKDGVNKAIISEELHNKKHEKPDSRNIHYTVRLFKFGDDTEEQRFESWHVYVKKAGYFVSRWDDKMEKLIKMDKNGKLGWKVTTVKWAALAK